MRYVLADDQHTVEPQAVVNTTGWPAVVELDDRLSQRTKQQFLLRILEWLSESNGHGSKEQ